MPPKKLSDCYLIVSLSARALAGSLSAAGLPVAAIDVFCDQDLDHVSCKVSVFDTPNLLHAINEVNKKTPCKYLIIGGGIESCTDLLDQLPGNIILLGNFPEVLQATNNPEIFFKLLDKLKIPHPETVFELPPAAKGWLVKQANSCGGSGVRLFDPDHTYSSSCYFQKFIQGRVCSAVFIADSQKAQVIGYNEIWSESDSLSKFPGFKFAGAISLPDFPGNLNEIINDYLQLLTNELSLIGLCGMDFIIDDQDNIQVLEINPRPTATFELHDQDGDLMLQHINACQYGKLDSDQIIRAEHSYAKQIFYTEEPMKIGQEIQWPEWVADLPHAGQIIKAHEPVCTIYADAEHVSKAKELLRERMLLAKETLRTSLNY